MVNGGWWMMVDDGGWWMMVDGDANDDDHNHVVCWTRRSWLYVQGSEGRDGGGTMVWVAILAGSFNPERYQALLGTMVSLYTSTGSPPKLLECFLSVQIRGRYQQFTAADYDPRKALLVSNIKVSFAEMVS